MDDRDFLDKQFELVKDSHTRFSLMAQVLKHSAEIIYEQIEGDVKRNIKREGADIDNVLSILTVGLLCGFALENMLKAVITKQKGSLFYHNEFKYKGHNLNKLADKTNISFSNNERTLFKNLTDYGEWMGRYPAPLIKEQMKIGKPEDFSMIEFNDLFSRLKNELGTG